MLKPRAKSNNDRSTGRIPIRAANVNRIVCVSARTRVRSIGAATTRKIDIAPARAEWAVKRAVRICAHYARDWYNDGTSALCAEVELGLDGEEGENEGMGKCGLGGSVCNCWRIVYCGMLE